MSKPGDTLETALWFNAEHPREEHDARTGIYKAFLVMEDHHKIEIGPVTFSVMEHGDPRVPNPPPGFSGTPKLMVGEALVIKKLALTTHGEVGLTNDLKPEDLELLRDVTQKTYFLHNPAGTPPLTNEQLDLIINEVGPETALKSLRDGGDSRSMH